MNRNTPEYRAMMKQAIEELKVNDPQKFAELQKRARDDSYDRQVRAREALEQREAYEREKLTRFNKPVLVGLPNIDLSSVRGIVAYKTWNFDGRLKSSAMNYYWKELNFADRVPTEHNNSGFYCIKLSSLSVMSTGSDYFSSYGRRGVSGFVELLGKVVEHADGVLRAEVAKLLYLFVTSDNDNVSYTVKRLYENYITPVYVLNPAQLADVVLREVFRQKFYGGIDGWNS